jgi:hypothetical protein
MPDQSCPSESISVNSTSSTGAFIFNPDGTYEASLDASASETLTVPLSCLTLNGVTTCDQFGVELSTSVQLADGGPSPIADTCTTSGSTCHCSVTVTLNGLSATGTYTVSGTHVTTMPDGSNGTGGGDFCVQGNTLRLFGNAMVAAGMMQGMAGMPPSVLVAERQ